MHKSILFVCLLVFVAGCGPKTYKEIADDYTSDCVLNKGWGHWAASDGMTLEQFCAAAGKLHALEQAKQDHPEQF